MGFSFLGSSPKGYRHNYHRKTLLKGIFDDMTWPFNATIQKKKSEFTRILCNYTKLEFLCLCCFSFDCDHDNLILKPRRLNSDKYFGRFSAVQCLCDSHKTT